MIAGTLMVSAGLYALSLVRSEGAWLAAWVFLGLGMRLSLYDAAFAALVQVVPSRGRLAISYLTLWGAFASTVFWVVGHYFNEAGGLAADAGAVRRDQPRGLPAAQLDGARAQGGGGACSSRGGGRGAGRRAAAPLEGGKRAVALALFALVMSLNGFVFGVIAVQLVPLLEAAGLATAAAVWVASLKGFAQFGGRVVEIVFGRNLHAMTVARIAIGVLPAAFVLLVLSSGNVGLILAFTLLMGASQGVITIVRGAVTPRAFRADRLRRGARAPCHPHTDRQRGLADAVRADRRSLGLAGRTGGADGRVRRRPG